MRTTSAGRRRFVSQSLALAATGCVAALLPPAAPAAAATLVSPDEPDAKALKYTEDAHAVKGIPAGNTCANCALYQGASNSSTGACQAFGGRSVKAAGWCSSWTPQI